MFTINAAEGDSTVLPKKRSYKLSFRDISGCAKIQIVRNDKEEELSVEETKKVVAYPGNRKYLSIQIEDVKPDEKVQIILDDFTALRNQDTKEALVETISRFQSRMDVKMFQYSKFIEDPTLPIPGRKQYKGPIEEILNL